MALPEEPTFSQDLGGLWLVSHVHLPAVAGTFATVSGRLNKSTLQDDAFTTASPIEPAWTAMRDRLQELLAMSANAVYEACDTVDRVIELYRSTDKDAATKLQADITQYTNDGDYTVVDPADRLEPVIRTDNLGSADGPYEVNPDYEKNDRTVDPKMPELAG